MDNETVATFNSVEMQEFFDALPDGLIGVDRDGRISHFNRAAEKLFDYRAEEVAGQSMELLLPPDKRELHRLQRGHFVASKAERSVGRGVTALRKDGSTIEVDITLRTMGEGKELVVFALVREALNQALQRLNSYMGLLLESVADGVFSVDTEGCCTFLNRVAEKMLGYRLEEVLGRDMHTLTHHTMADGEHYPAAHCPIYGTYHYGKACWKDNEIFWRKDGSYFEVEYSASPVQEGNQVVGAVTVFRDLTSQRAMTRELDYLASHDPLTDLFNRREFDRRLQNLLEDTRRSHARHVLCFLDLDQFKVVNDSCGHAAGDELLRQIASVMLREIRRGDILARLGGDEFGLLLQDCDLEHAMHVMRQISRIVNEFRFVWEEKTFAVGMSIGMVAVDSETEDVAKALSAADRACYLAKDDGRSRIHIYQPDDADLVKRYGEVQWVSRIREALDADRFALRYQPIVPVNNPGGSRMLMEILLDMKDRDGQTIPPGAFLPAAERYGLMPSIDRWVVSHTFAFLHEHPQVRELLAICFINLSGNTLADETFDQFVVDELQRFGLKPSQIAFEITETAAIANLQRALQLIDRLKALGCYFALDDFGSGMSSFSYLKNLPVDFLKIDGSFVRDIARDPVDRAMVEAINKVGQVMNLKTIAEFVEDGDVIEHLLRIGVDYVQGYYIDHPRPLDELIELI